MSTSSPLSARGSRSAARVLLGFLGSMIALLLVTLVFGQLNLPYYGQTVWDLGCLGIARACDFAFNVLLPYLGDVTASHYPVLTGMVGVSWLTHIYFRVHRTGCLKLSWVVDPLGILLSGFLLGTYFLCGDQVLPLNAGFFYRLALYCSIATVEFGLFAVLAHHAGLGREYTGGRDLKLNDRLMGCLVGSFIVSLVSAFVTFGRGQDVPSVSFLVYQLPNGVLHLMATVGAVVAAVMFVEQIDENREEGDAPSADSPAAVEGHVEQVAESASDSYPDAET